MLTQVITRRREIDVVNLLSQVKNEEVIDFFRTTRFFKLCKRIANGKYHKMRHDLVVSGTFDQRFANYMHLSNVCFLDDTEEYSDIDQQLKEVVYNFFHHLTIRGVSHIDSWFRFMYTNHVLIPEGIICFLMQKFHLNYKIANEIFVKTCTADVYFADKMSKYDACSSFDEKF